MRRLPSARGFTLLELLIAVSVFAVLSIMSYSALSSAVRQKQQGQEQANRLKGLQMGLLVMERDLQQALDRPTQVGTTLEPAFEYIPLEARMALTRSGWSNPLGQPRGEIQRVAYRYEKGKLYRDTWFHVDRLQDDQPQEAVLLDELDDWQIRFMNQDHKWQEAWPPRNAKGQATDALPLAVQFSFRMKDWGEIHRIIRMADQ